MFFVLICMTNTSTWQSWEIPNTCGWQPAGCGIISCCPLLLELTSLEPLTLDEEVGMQEEWHRDERKCTFVILTRDLLLLDLNIVSGDDQPSISVA